MNEKSSSDSADMVTSACESGGFAACPADDGEPGSIDRDILSTEPAMRLKWWAVPTAVSLVAGSQLAHGEPRCPQVAAPGETSGTPSAKPDPPPSNPGPLRVQHLLSSLAARNVPDWASPCRYAAANIVQHQAGHPVAVFIGDSITDNWGQNDPAFFAEGFVDRGISGQTSAQILLRFTRDVVALRPAVVHIMAGTNDIAENSGPVSDDFIETNIGAMIDLARANGIRVVLASIPPAKAFPWSRMILPAARIRELNQHLRALAAQRGIGYVDYYPVLAEPDGGMRPEYSGDGVHPNKAGYTAIAAAARAAIAQALRQSL